jgi:5-(carboxyamino)imidazole ribonucleotide synthase
MVNLVGSEPDRADVLATPWARLHRYGKEPRAGRKIGHVNVIADSERELQLRLRELAGRLQIADAQTAD